MKVATIEQAEESVELALIGLRAAFVSDPVRSEAVRFLCPPGFRPVVELFEDDRKKRRTAAIESWSPATGEIRIVFEPVISTRIERPAAGAVPTPNTSASEPALSGMLTALQQAETAPGRSFVALKWFRDEFLSGMGGNWASSTTEQRQALLAEAIRDGWIVTSKVANPKAPLYPTTTIRVNRQRQAPGAVQGSRFRPVPPFGGTAFLDHP